MYKYNTAAGTSERESVEKQKRTRWGSGQMRPRETKRRIDTCLSVHKEATGIGGVKGGGYRNECK